MKKIKILLMSALALGLASCDMDKEPYDQIPATEALETPTDFSNMSVSLYTGLRSSVGGQLWTAPELQCDGFNAISGDNSGLADFYRWDFTTSAGAVETAYGNFQALIARANFIIDGYNKCDMSDETEFTPEAVASVKNIKGEAFFIRSYALFGLAQYFCKAYNNDIADEANSGVSYRTDYAPSSEVSTYPARKTMRQTYKQITDDLDSAALYVTHVGDGVNNRYISTNAIKALRARVALAMGEYQTAINEAVDLIESGDYSLARNSVELRDMWQNDGGTECILQLAVTNLTELPAQLGDIFQPYDEGGLVSIVPTKTLVNLYSDNDYRKVVYFNQNTFQTNTGARGTLICFNKYIDQTAIYQQFQNEYARFCIEPKVFRIAEMYLIAAEAYAQLGDFQEGSKYLNTLLSYRGVNLNGAENVDPETGVNKGGYGTQSITSAATLMSKIRDERQREMVCEGTRLFDLKRWNMDVVRGVPQDDGLCYQPGTNTTELRRSAGDNRFVWPIPRAEMDANPNVVQNEGY